MESVLPVRVTTRSLPHRACPVRVEAAPTATVPAVRVPQQVPVDPVPVVPVPQQAPVGRVPRLAPAARARVHPVPVVPVETVLPRA